ncbi:MAG: prepilin-type N-terminal cleavage/methylation domain-containing protein [Planctomycetota bacterium]|nr:prepilin-type N-terminal cleavage/methylation domain-containing protein [Planctomycetota bacterium]
MSSAPAQTRASRGFTLIELLVCVSIIALLMSLLLPSLGKARLTAQVLKDQANLHGVAQTVHIYAADQNGMLPPGPSEYGYSLGQNVWASGRGMWGTMGALTPSGFPTNVQWNPKGLGLLSTEYGLNPDWLFDYYRENTNFFPDAYVIFSYIAPNKSTIWPGATNNTFTFSAGRLQTLFGTGPTIASNDPIWGVKNNGQSHIEGDFFYRCGDYSTLNATFTTVTSVSVGAQNARTDATNFSRKTFITEARNWYQDRPSRKWALGIGYDCAFGDGSVAFFKVGNGDPSTNPAAYALAGTFTSGTLTNAYSGQPNNQSGQVIFNRADAYFNR